VAKPRGARLDGHDSGVRSRHPARTGAERHPQCDERRKRRPRRVAAAVTGSWLVWCPAGVGLSRERRIRSASSAGPSGDTPSWVPGNRKVAGCSGRPRSRPVPGDAGAPVPCAVVVALDRPARRPDNPFSCGRSRDRAGARALWHDWHWSWKTARPAITASPGAAAGALSREQGPARAIPRRGAVSAGHARAIGDRVYGLSAPVGEGADRSGRVLGVLRKRARAGDRGHSVRPHLTENHDHARLRVGAHDGAAGVVRALVTDTE